MTVAICTRDRAALLPGCIRSVAAEVERDGDAEIVVVDSASRDDTPDIVHQFATTMPFIRHRRVDEPGVGIARQVACAAARGEVVAFVDDDALVRPGWLAGIRAAFADDDVAAAGGPIFLEWVAGRPRWMSPALERWYSGLDHGAAARDLGPTELLWGANLAVRRSAMVGVGGFATALGRRTSLESCEEVELERRLEVAGHRRRYDPAAAVTHLVSAERCSLRWLLRRGWWQGRSEARVDRLHHRRLPLALAARHIGAHAVHGALRDLRGAVVGPTRAGALVDLVCMRVVAAGYAREVMARPLTG